jgi:hypothetical protein
MMYNVLIEQNAELAALVRVLGSVEIATADFEQQEAAAGAVLDHLRSLEVLSQDQWLGAELQDIGTATLVVALPEVDVAEWLEVDATTGRVAHSSDED